MDRMCTTLLSLLGDRFDIFHRKEFKKNKNTILRKPSERRGHHQSSFKAEETETQSQQWAGRITQSVWTPVTENKVASLPFVSCSLFYITVTQSGSH